MSTHSVESHLGIRLEDYDTSIRAFVPHYDEMQRAGIETLTALLPPDAEILELGCGTGRFCAAILEAMPRASVIAIDVDSKILEVARMRLAPHGNRVTFVEGSFDAKLPTAAAVVASLSLHHVRDLGEKTRIYASIRESLMARGLFLNLDATVSADPRFSEHSFARWVAFMVEHGIAEAEARGHLASWGREERYFPLHEEFSALRRAGFVEPECFWRKGPVAVVGACR